MAKYYWFKEREREIVRCLAEHDLCMTAVAKVMNYHLQTIVYYVRKIEGKTGLCPTKFYDMIKLLEMVEKQEEVANG